MRILIVDAVCYKPYDVNTLETQPLGGTEATTVRLAEAFARRGHAVRVTQHIRTSETTFGATYVPFNTNQSFNPTHVIVLRAPLMLYPARKQFPNAKLFLHCHDLFSAEGWDNGSKALVDTQAVPVVVSDFHRQNFYDTLHAINFQGQIPCRRIYNPIEDSLVPNGTPTDYEKFVFFSSPHKGLELTLKTFERFKDFPELRDSKLYVANPGYFTKDKLDLTNQPLMKKFFEEGLPNVIDLGPLSHTSVINHVRSAFLVLHLNNVYPETFGLVHAEANAVGTPFISSKLGATTEVVDHHHETLDVTDPKQVIDRIIQWKKTSRPKVRGQPTFRMNKIIREWEELMSL